MLRAGLVAIDNGNRWVGGRYYLHHLVRSVAALPPQERPQLRELRWGAAPDEGAFDDVRALVGDAIVVAPPTAPWPRIVRKLRRIAGASPGARDLFRASGIDVCFPVPPCEDPGIPYVFWLPDFQYLRRPDLMSAELRDRLEAYYRLHVREAARIVLSSEDARADFAKVFPADLDRTHVVRFCSVPDAQWWRLDPASTARDLGLPPRFLIVCNQFTRHKNHLLLAEALAQAAKAEGPRDLHLVCTGSTFDHRGEDYAGQFRALAERLGVASRISVLGLVDRAQQIALVRQSVAVLQPSTFEGWSTVIEDAKSLGKPVIASHLPVHAEQLGAGSILLDPQDAAAWATAIVRAWTDHPGGVDAQQEAQARARVHEAQLACGRAFAAALQAGAGAGA